ncbi:MAG: thermonuclease family protein [Planktothrix sp.]|uniref:thermonuclease family protein n=1 Tax=Planktothrix sp. TaxID=3088171 RepID=UPI0038D3CE69
MQLQIKLSSLYVLLTTLLLSPPAVANPVTALVTGITDGDTLTINAQNQNITIRLACIDAPETKQPGGRNAATFLSQLAPVGSSITVVPVAKDQYGRVGVVFGKDNRGGNVNVNVKLVENGHAVVYQQYLINCPSSRQDLVRAEASAKQRRQNFWNQTNPCMPWDFRQGKCSTAAAPEPQQQGRCDPSYPDVCIPPAPPDLDCGEITHRRFRVTGSDPHGFDGDNDGIGCES